MPLEPGTHLGNNEVVASLGALYRVRADGAGDAEPIFVLEGPGDVVERRARDLLRDGLRARCGPGADAGRDLSRRSSEAAVRRSPGGIAGRGQKLSELRCRAG